MGTSKFVQLLLTCEDQAEAEKIAKALLERRLIACAKFVPIDCMYWWQGKIVNGNEVLVMMESREDLFDLAEAEIAKLHSYDTFVLQALPFDHVSKKATGWLDKELRAGDNR